MTSASGDPEPFSSSRELRFALGVAFAALLVFLANGRAIDAGDTFPARYLPFEILHHHSVTFEQALPLATQGREKLLASMLAAATTASSISSRHSSTPPRGAALAARHARGGGRGPSPDRLLRERGLARRCTFRGVLPAAVAIAAAALWPVHLVWSVGALQAGLPAGRVRALQWKYRALYGFLGALLVADLLR